MGRETELSNGCIIGAMCDVTSHELLPENTVIYGSTCDRRQQSERPPVSFEYHRLNACRSFKCRDICNFNIINRKKKKIECLEKLFHNNL